MPRKARSGGLYAYTYAGSYTGRDVVVESDGVESKGQKSVWGSRPATATHREHVVHSDNEYPHLLVLLEGFEG
jgi:hypothetical protein